MKGINGAKLLRIEPTARVTAHTESFHESRYRNAYTAGQFEDEFVPSVPNAISEAEVGMLRAQRAMSGA